MKQHKQPNVPVYVVDLAGLQFQQAYNSGRLVLITADSSGTRVLDNLIFEKVVGEKKETYEEASTRASKGDARFVEVQSKCCKREPFYCIATGHCVKKGVYHFSR